MRISAFAILFILLFPSLVMAQEPRMRYRAKKAVYVDFGGSGGITANFDYLTMEIDNIKTSVRLGGGLYPYKINGQNKLMPVVPFEFLGFVGQKAGNLELGL